ncbi:MAG: tRNA uridine-5-carboxymethylaminomethyl(34) synthesis GTPase MnmE [Peptococcaceae bacterium]|nr:tRNA uridine-5-carboxymethylaminomethyl(34) synthesis GTPase MnmE [Peptococcaceae bacterium]
MLQQDTIAALVTAVGESSVGIIRISGPEAVKIAAKIYQGKSDLMTADTHTIHYGYVYDWKHDKKIDEALFMLMRGPRSFTGEDVVEVQCHGGMVVLKQVLQLILLSGARLAEQGEYSKRAFLNGRLDLAQAESIMDIVQAKTDKGVDLALSQLQGNLSGMVKTLRADLLELIAFIQADIDYPDDDIERLTTEQQQERILNLKAQVNAVLKNAQKGKMIRDGLKVVIAGKPNVGKSSLLNALLGQERAIVTDIPGTTRDVIEEYINLNGIPLKIVDTAGIRETDNVVEQIGVDKAQQFVKNADLVLYVVDAVQGLTEQDEQMMADIHNQPVIYLLNKSDMGISDAIRQQLNDVIGTAPVLEISAREKIGLEQLEEKITDLFFAGTLEVSNDIMVTNVRHIQILEESLAHMDGFLNGIMMGLSVDFLVIDLQNAWEKLGKITGETVEEDLLDQIFSKFCLGK